MSTQRGTIQGVQRGKVAPLECLDWRNTRAVALNIDKYFILLCNFIFCHVLRQELATSPFWTSVSARSEVSLDFQRFFQRTNVNAFSWQPMVLVGVFLRCFQQCHRTRLFIQLWRPLSGPVEGKAKTGMCTVSQQTMTDKKVSLSRLSWPFPFQCEVLCFFPRAYASGEYFLRSQGWGCFPEFSKFQDNLKTCSTFSGQFVRNFRFWGLNGSNQYLALSN